MHHALRRSIALATLATLAACRSASTAPKSQFDSIAGTWHLKTVNGSPLPWGIQTGATRVSLTSDQLTITDGGTWSESSTFSVVVDGAASQQQVKSDAGTWTRVGAQVTFKSPTSGTSNGTFTGSTFVMTDAAGTAVYSR